MPDGSLYLLDGCCYFRLQHRFLLSVPGVYLRVLQRRQSACVKPDKSKRLYADTKTAYSFLLKKSNSRLAAKIPAGLFYGCARQLPSESRPFSLIGDRKSTR